MGWRRAQERFWIVGWAGDVIDEILSSVAGRVWELGKRIGETNLLGVLLVTFLGICIIDLRPSKA